MFPMLTYFEKNWWLWSLRGVIAVGFGALSFAAPELTLTAMILLLSGFVFTDGMFALLTLFAHRTDERWSWSAFVEGLAGVLVSTLICLIPSLSLMALLYFASGWAVISGLCKMIEAAHCHKTGIIPGTWLLGISGFLSTALGLAGAFFPALGFVGLAWILGVYAMLFGLMMIAEGLRLRRFYRIFDVKKVHLKIQPPFYPA